MKLERFKDSKKKNIGAILGIGSIVLLLAVVIVYRSYSIYQEKQEFDVIRGNVPDQNYDAMFTFYLVDETGTKKLIETIPEGRDYYISVICNHNANGSWNQDMWGPVITNLTNTRTKCDITFKNKLLLIDAIKSIPIASDGKGLYQIGRSTYEITYTDDETAISNLRQMEYRYAGSDPNNYITFNGEVAGWRVIGLVNTPEGSRVKLVRNESIGNYSWDSSASNINNGYGINEWSQADIKNLLNDGPYYNRTSGDCYAGENNTMTSCNFEHNGLTSDAKQMIDTVTWNLGSTAQEFAPSNAYLYLFYKYERSNYVGKTCSGASSCNDTVVRTTSWKGQVGLIYPSDYGYATSGGNGVEQGTCLNMLLKNWGVECYQNDWLFHSNHVKWSMTPNSYSNTGYGIWDVTNSGILCTNYATRLFAVYPTVYLKEDILLIDGDGSKENPFVISK